VFQMNCRLRLVLASEYRPRPQAAPSAVRETADEVQNPQPAEDDEVPEPISRWAEEHGAQVKIVD
jgi:hypothetical protein